MKETPNKAMEQRFPMREFMPLRRLLREKWPGLNPPMVSQWCKTGKYPYAVRQGKQWFIHPEQFEMWFRDGEG